MSGIRKRHIHLKYRIGPQGIEIGSFTEPKTVLNVQNDI